MPLPGLWTSPNRLGEWGLSLISGQTARRLPGITASSICFITHGGMGAQSDQWSLPCCAEAAALLQTLPLVSKEKLNILAKDEILTESTYSLVNQKCN